MKPRSISTIRGNGQKESASPRNQFFGKRFSHQTNTQRIGTGLGKNALKGINAKPQIVKRKELNLEEANKSLLQFKPKTGPQTPSIGTTLDTKTNIYKDMDLK